jgi:4-oxalocrotonate tautomerase
MLTQHGESNRAVPYINVQITPAISREQKRAIVGAFTQTLVDLLGKHPAHIHIVIQEVEEENWGFAGQLTDDYLSGRGEHAG